jgi:hypothetical protein
MNIIPFCGCDGMTFESPQDCPDRPWDRAGACEDGFNCDPWRAECEDDPPTCAEGEVPSVVDGCWGDCVVAESCRCVYHWQCGDVPEYACNLETFFCEPSPPSE